MVQVVSNRPEEGTKKIQQVLFLKTVSFTGIWVCSFDKDLLVQNKPLIFQFHQTKSNEVHNSAYVTAMKVKSTN